MATQAHRTTNTAITRLSLGASTVALAGAGLIIYGTMFLIRNFNGFIELGLTPALIGTTAEALHQSNPRLYHYISHLQVALAGFIIGLGLAVIALAWFGIRTRARWALGKRLPGSGRRRGPGAAAALPLRLRHGRPPRPDLSRCRHPAG